MKVKFRFPNYAVWGSIVLMLLIIIGCSVPSGTDGTEAVSDPPIQEAADSEDEKQTPGEEQKPPDGTDNEEGKQTPGAGEEQKPIDAADNDDEKQTSDEEQKPTDTTDNEEGKQNPGAGEEQKTENNEGFGFLSWNINYPEEKIWGAALMVSLKIDNDTFIPYSQFELISAGNQKASLPPGTYRVEARFLSHNVETGSTETVHIYAGQETRSSLVTIPESVFPEPRTLLSVEALAEYLAGRPENTGNTPYPIKISGVDLSSTEEKGETLNTLYDALKQRYVTLDLRGCGGTKLSAASTAHIANRETVVSLVLPDSVTEISANGFSGYTSLKSVVLPKVQTINTSAFKNCTLLETVFAPKLEIVTEAANNTSGAFVGCIALKTLYFPSLILLGKYAVYGCSSLTDAAFPRLQILDGLAFRRCTALRAVSLPAVVKIASNSFTEDTALAYLILGAKPPELGTSVFQSTDFPQSGIIYAPSDAVSTYKNTNLANWPKVKNLVKPLPNLAVL
ncbi:MAG: leucine-rich repeat protein [Spirochaetaceae bacterium]|jgi:hypothetical protein|nr:leucine-rich repeat protein [Spirochaetaceae bacterium]